MLKRYWFIVFTFLIVCPLAVLQAQVEGRSTLPQQVNSSFTEIRPFIAADGSKLYFSRKEHPENANGSKDLQDVYVAEREGDSWGKVKNLGAPVNNRFSNSLGAVSPEGDELLMLNTYRWLGGQLARFKKQGEGWGEPQPVSIEDFQNYSEYFDFFQSYQEDVLLIAVEREDSRGEQDLYVCFRKEKDKWSQPLNLGPIVNTAKSDFAPFLASDGRTLFFASYGIKGKGSADLFYVQRLDDSWTNWSKPVNLGAPINSRAEETYCSLTADGSTIFYTSYQTGAVVRDIYESPMPADFRLLPPLPGHRMIAVAAPASLPKNTLLAAAVPEQDKEVKQSLLNTAVAETFLTAPAEVESTSTGDETNPVRQATANPSSSPGPAGAGAAATNTDPLSLALKHREVPSDIPHMKQYEILRNLYFDFNQETLPSNAYAAMLQEVSNFMKANPEAQLKVVGHADELGTSKENLKISQLRAQSVKQQLVGMGLVPERVLVHFRGEEVPLASNDDEREGRELNRRVVLYMLLPDK